MPPKVKDSATLTKNVASLHHKLEDIGARLERVERRLGMYHEPERVETAHAAPVSAARSRPEPVQELPHIENLGFKVFGAVGFLFIILGFYYLYSWAVEQGILSPAGRIALGVIASIVLIAGSEWFVRQRLAQFANVLTGGGVALLYFTVYASYHFPAFRTALGISLGLNIVLLLAVAALGVWLALRVDSKLLTGFAFFLAYTTSFLPGGHQGLIAAIIISAALWVILMFKEWHYAYIPVLAAYLVFFVESTRYARDGLSPTAMLVYLAILFILFVILSFRYEDDSGVAIAVAIKNGLFTFLLGISIVSMHFYAYRGVFTFILAAVHLLLWLIADARKMEHVANAFLVIAAGLSLVGIAVQLQRAWVSILWSIEGALLILLGIKYNRIGLRVSGYAALMLASLRVLTFDSWQLAGAERTTVFVILALALAAVTWMLYQRSDLLKKGMTAPYIATFTTSFVITVLLAIDILAANGVFSALPMLSRSAMLTMAWLLVGIVGFGWGTRSDFFGVQICTGGILAIAAFKTVFIDAAIPTGIRTLVYVFAVTVLAVATFLLAQRVKEQKRPDYRFVTAFAIAAILVFTVAVAVEVLDGRGVFGGLSANTRDAIVSAVWALESIALIAAGFLYGSQAVRTCGIILFSLTVAKVLLFDLSGLEDVYRVLVTIFIGVLALGGSYAYVKNKDRLEKLIRT